MYAVTIRSMQTICESLSCILMTCQSATTTYICSQQWCNTILNNYCFLLTVSYMYFSRIIHQGTPKKIHQVSNWTNNWKRKMATLFPPNLCTSVMSAETLLKEEGGGVYKKSYRFTDLENWHIEIWNVILENRDGKLQCHIICYSGIDMPVCWTPLFITTKVADKLFHWSIFQAYMEPLKQVVARHTISLYKRNTNQLVSQFTYRQWQG